MQTPTKVASKCNEAMRAGSKKIAPRRLEYYEKVRRERLRLLIVAESEANSFRSKLQTEAHQNRSPPKAGADQRIRQTDSKNDEKNGTKITKLSSSSRPVRSNEPVIRRVKPPGSSAEKPTNSGDKRIDQRRASSASAVQRFSTSMTSRLLAEAALEKNIATKIIPTANTAQKLESLNDKIEKAFADFEAWSSRPTSNRSESEIQQRSAPASRSASQHPSPNTLLPDVNTTEIRGRAESMTVPSVSKSESGSPAKRTSSFTLKIDEPVVHPLALRNSVQLRFGSVANGSLPNLTANANSRNSDSAAGKITANGSASKSDVNKPVAAVKPCFVSGDGTTRQVSQTKPDLDDRVDQILRNAVAIEREWSRFKQASSAHEARSARLSASLSRLVRSITTEAEGMDEQCRSRWTVSSAHSALFPQASATTDSSFQVQVGGAWATARRKPVAATHEPEHSTLVQSPKPECERPDELDKQCESPRRVAFDLNTIRNIPYSIRKPLYSGIVARSKRPVSVKPVSSILKKDTMHRCDGEAEDVWDELSFDHAPDEHLQVQFEPEPAILSSSAPQ